MFLAFDLRFLTVESGQKDLICSGLAPASVSNLQFHFMTKDKINIAIVGLGFGAEFIPIYQRHPNANMYAICQRTRRSSMRLATASAIEKRYTDFEAVLAGPEGGRRAHQFARFRTTAGNRSPR